MITHYSLFFSLSRSLSLSQKWIFDWSSEEFTSHIQLLRSHSSFSFKTIETHYYLYYPLYSFFFIFWFQSSVFWPCSCSRSCCCVVLCCVVLCCVVLCCVVLCCVVFCCACCVFLTCVSWLYFMLF
jgi:hypothetical protein